MPIWNLSRIEQSRPTLELTLDGRLMVSCFDDERAERDIADALGQHADLAPWALNIARKVGEISFGRRS